MLNNFWRSLPPFFRVLLFVLLGLWSYIFLRAIMLCYTHDEGLTFTIINGNTDWVKTANNHFLNTLLTGISAFVLGTNEWALRLPNVLAFGLYAYFGFRLLRPLPSLYAALGASILFFNPFILDFFSLSRGYGLALALQMTAIFYTVFFSQTYHIRYAYWATIAGGLMLYANFSFLVPYFALVCICAMAYLQHEYQQWQNTCPELSNWKVKLSSFYHNIKLKPLIILLLSVLLWSLPAIAFSFLLKAKGELYFGGSNGFFANTVQSLLQTLVYQPYNNTGLFANWGIGIWALYSVVTLLLLRYWQYWFRSYFGTIFLMLNISLIAVLGLYYGMGVLLPIERTALYFIPITGLSLAYGTYTLAMVVSTVHNKTLKIPLYLFAIELTILLSANFLANANLTHTLTWQYDADTYKALITLQDDYQQRYNYTKVPTKIATTWHLEPVVNYYRITRHLDWLAPVTRNNIDAKNYDYYFCFPEDANYLNTQNRQIALLQYFKQTHNILLATSR